MNTDDFKLCASIHLTMIAGSSGAPLLGFVTSPITKVTSSSSASPVPRSSKSDGSGSSRASDSYPRSFHRAFFLSSAF